MASPKRKKRGKVLMALGLLSAAAAGVAAFMKRSAPKDDPWATPLEDPYVAPSTGRHSSLDPMDADLEGDTTGATLTSADGSSSQPKATETKAAQAKGSEAKATATKGNETKDAPGSGEAGSESVTTPSDTSDKGEGP